MTDGEIIELYFSRNEEAIAETRRLFGALMRSIAKGVLPDRRDAEETVSDALLSVWRSIPPNRPNDLSAYVSRVTRNAAVDRARMNLSKKRGGGEYDAVLEEARELAGSVCDPEKDAENAEFSGLVNGFLAELPKRKRMVFVKRYWYLLPIKRIARDMDMSEAAVKMELSRTRSGLKEFLKKEGYYDE
jgi:RNA polymerase sigma-70 factor (ECF subfamily)